MNPNPENRNAELSPEDLLPLLNCPECSPPAFLVAPTTLKCGHTICAEHVTLSHPATPLRPGPPILPACPLPTCQPMPPPSSFLRPNIPPESTVSYFPPQTLSAAPVAGPSRVTDIRLDVTVCKILSLVQRAIQEAREQDPDDVALPASSDNDSESESDQSEDEPFFGNKGFTSEETPSGSISRIHRSSSPARRPPTRLRTNSPPQSQILPNTEFPIEKLQKELLIELGCEICFLLLYQPVTTPCQHVRIHNSQ